MRYLVICILIVLAGCGYHTPGDSDSWVGGEAKTVYVDFFENLSSEPYLDNFMTESLVSELSRSRKIVLTEDRSGADLHLIGTVDSFGTEAAAYNANDRITDYRAVMYVTVRLERPDNEKTVWKNTFDRKEHYLASVDKNQQLDERRITAELITERLAEDIYSHLMDTF